nr:hypothetical protein [uncultured Butyrivibrio sp.]
MVRQINSIKDEIADMVTSTQPISLEIKNVLARFAKPYDVYVDPSSGELTIDNIRAAAYRGTYTKNDCNFITEFVRKFVKSIKDADFKDYAEKQLETMSPENDMSIREACDNISARYDLMTRLDPDRFPPYGVLNWNGQYQYITKCGAMPEDVARGKNLRRMVDDVAFYLLHCEKVSKMDVEMYKDEIVPARENKYREFIRTASLRTPGINVSYVPDKGVDIFISVTGSDREKYIQFQDINMDEFKLSPVSSIRKAADHAGLSREEKLLINGFLSNLSDEIEFANRVREFRKLGPPREYTKEDYAKDKKKAAMRADEILHEGLGRAE